MPIEMVEKRQKIKKRGEQVAKQFGTILETPLANALRVVGTEPASYE